MCKQETERPLTKEAAAKIEKNQNKQKNRRLSRNAISVVDGAYARESNRLDLRPILSQTGFISCMVLVEINWRLFQGCSENDTEKLKALRNMALSGLAEEHIGEITLHSGSGEAHAVRDWVRKYAGLDRSHTGPLLEDIQLYAIALRLQLRKTIPILRKGIKRLETALGDKAQHTHLTCSDTLAKLEKIKFTSILSPSPLQENFLRTMDMHPQYTEATREDIRELMYFLKCLEEVAELGIGRCYTPDIPKTLASYPFMIDRKKSAESVQPQLATNTALLDFEFQTIKTSMAQYRDIVGCSPGNTKEVTLLLLRHIGEPITKLTYALYRLSGVVAA